MRAEKQEYYRKITLSSCNTEVHGVALRYTKKGKRMSTQDSIQEL